MNQALLPLAESVILHLKTESGLLFAAKQTVPPGSPEYDALVLAIRDLHSAMRELRKIKLPSQPVLRPGTSAA